MDTSVQPSFSERFAEIWKEPTAEAFGELFTEDVVLYQPHLPPIRGKQAATAEFRRLFRWLPGTYSKVKCWREDNNVALIEHELHLPVGRGYIRIPAVDRFSLEAGFAKERVVYFDQLRLLRGVLRYPSLWLGFIKYSFGGLDA
jgi:hypothetical protein